MTWGMALLVVSGIATLLQLLALSRQRRLFLFDPQRRRFFLDYIQRQPAVDLPAARPWQRQREIARVAVGGRHERASRRPRRTGGNG